MRPYNKYEDFIDNKDELKKIKQLKEEILQKSRNSNTYDFSFYQKYLNNDPVYINYKIYLILNIILMIITENFLMAKDCKQQQQHLIRSKQRYNSNYYTSIIQKLHRESSLCSDGLELFII